MTVRQSVPSWSHGLHKNQDGGIKSGIWCSGSATQAKAPWDTSWSSGSHQDAMQTLFQCTVGESLWGFTFFPVTYLQNISVSVPRAAADSRGYPSLELSRFNSRSSGGGIKLQDTQPKDSLLVSNYRT